MKKQHKTLKALLSVLLVIFMMCPGLAGISVYAASTTIHYVEDDFHMALPDDPDAPSLSYSLEEYILSEIMNCSTSIDLSSYNLAPSKIDYIASFIYDNSPELFHVTRFGYTTIFGYILTINPEYSCTAEEYQEMMAECDAVTENMIADIKDNDNLTDVEKALLVHDRIALNCAYDYDNYLNDTVPYYSYSMYGVLVNGVGVCQGYAEAYLYILRQLGIDGYLCESDTLNHAWNIVTINGYDYHVDITWDDPVNDITGRVMHKNFLRSSDGIYATGHEADDYDTTPSSTTYDNYFWQNSSSAFQLAGDEIYYIDETDSNIKKYSDNSVVKSVSDRWMTSASSYYPGCYARLASDGTYLYYNSSQAVFEFDPANGTATEIWRPESETEYYRIYGFDYADNYLICDFYTKPSFTLTTKDDYQQTMYYVHEVEEDNEILNALTYEIVDGEVTITSCDDAFEGEMIIPDTIEGYPVTSIGELAFDDCESLTSITIPSNVTSIGYDAFWCCFSLKSFIVDENNMNYSNDEFGVLFNKEKTTIMICPASNMSSSYVIPNSVKNIEDRAFMFCKNLENVTIPDSVTTLGMQAFAYCYSLTSITIPDTITNLPMEIFLYCTSLTDVKIPDSVTSFGFGVFTACSSLTNITIPNSVTSMDDAVFNACTNLKSITIPYGVSNIGHWTFANCTSLEIISIPNSVTTIDWNAFEDCESLTSINIPDSVTHIEGYAFYSCSNLKTITIPDSVTYISNWAFEYCESLTSITINNPECEIYDSSYTIYSDATIYGYEGSTAQAYAEKYGREFVAIDKCEHDYTAEVTTPPTCTENGVMTYTCSVCSDSYTEAIKSAGHTYDAVVTPPSCTEEGYTTYTCACGDSYVADYEDSLGHTYDAVVTPPTCTEDGYTTYSCDCGDTYVADYEDALGHSYNEVVAPPTCTEDGYTTYTCACGDSYVADYKDALGHSYDEDVTPPSCTEDGYTTYTCTCGDTFTDDYTDALGHEDNDDDEYCDFCDENLAEDTTINCSCNCHSTNSFISFFWKILNFFQKLFKTNPVCECGAAHY